LNTKLLAWKVEAGPFGPDDIPEAGGYSMVTILVSDFKNTEEYGDIDLYFPDFDSCYEFCTELGKSMEPLEIEI